MPKAVWKGVVIAESDDTVLVEGIHYFPPQSVETRYLEPSGTTSLCPWKGTASYYHVVIGGDRNEDAAWCYAAPKDAAKYIEGYVAFWRGVEVDQEQPG